MPFFAPDESLKQTGIYRRILRLSLRIRTDASAMKDGSFPDDPVRPFMHRPYPFRRKRHFSGPCQAPGFLKGPPDCGPVPDAVRVFRYGMRHPFTRSPQDVTVPFGSSRNLGSGRCFAALGRHRDFADTRMKCGKRKGHGAMEQISGGPSLCGRRPGPAPRAVRQQRHRPFSTLLRHPCAWPSRRKTEQDTRRGSLRRVILCCPGAGIGVRL